MSAKTDVIILTLASRAAGVVTRAELLDAGVASSTIGNRVRRGFLLTVWAGLYEVPEMTDETTRFFRAVKSAAGAATSHLTSGRVRSFPLSPADPAEETHITVPWGTVRTEIPGVVMHRTRRPYAEDISYPIRGLPTLSPARTILDLAGMPIITDRRLSHIVESQLTARTCTVGELEQLLDRPGLRGVPGAARLRHIVESQLDGQPVAESMLERRFGRLLRDHGMTGLRRQLKPPWYDGRRGIVDFANPDLRLIVEVDGRRWHSTSQALTDDRRRDRKAAAAGWQVLRVTESDLTDEPTATAEHVLGAISARRGLRRPILTPVLGT